MWNSFHTHFIDTSKEPATEELKDVASAACTVHLNLIKLFVKQKKISRSNFSVYMKLTLCFESFVIIFC